MVSYEIARNIKYISVMKEKDLKYNESNIKKNTGNCSSFMRDDNTGFIS